MCRFAAYLGNPLLMNEVLSKPKDSLIQQSREARETDVRVNGDGFGIGWYNLAVSEFPAVFVSDLPAWNDMNLKNISHQLVSSCFFGHVRAAEEGIVNQLNCHPFHYKKWMMMHNGGIGGFKKIKRAMTRFLDEEPYLQIKGQTDSERMFALWLHYYLPSKRTLADMEDAWRKTLQKIEDLQKEFNITEPNYINSVITDGQRMAAVRYSSRALAPLTLYYAAGQQFQHSSRGCHMLPAKNGRIESVLVVSERLTNFESEWTEVPPQHIFTVDEHRKIQALLI